MQTLGVADRRHPALAAYNAQMKEALTKQKDRMDTAFATEQAERRARREGRGGGVLGKHPADAESSLDAMKRAKIEPVEAMNVAFPGPPIVATGREIDVSPLPERFVIDAVMRGLQAISAEALTRILEVSGSQRTILILRRIGRLFNRVDRTRYRCYAKHFCLKGPWKRKRKSRMKMMKSSIRSIWMWKMMRIFW